MASPRNYRSKPSRPLTPDQIHAAYCDWRSSSPEQDKRYNQKADKILKYYYGL